MRMRQRCAKFPNMRSRFPEILHGRDVRLFDPATLARLSRARYYLAAHYNERNSLQDVACHAEFSPVHFNRLFAQAFNESPHELVKRLRIVQDKKVLLDG